MRKDGKSQYKIKKEKLLEIKNNLQTLGIELDLYATNDTEKIQIMNAYLLKIWEIVKNEK